MTFLKKKIPKWSFLLEEEELGCVGWKRAGSAPGIGKDRRPPRGDVIV